MNIVEVTYINADFKTIAILQSAQTGLLLINHHPKIIQ